MTLSRFLRDYLYIPLGGNRKGNIRTYVNLITTFLLGGLWHGAGWTFIIWGLLHGIALAIHRFWQSLGFRMNKILAWFITFNFINITWIFFRAKDFESAMKVLSSMFSFDNVVFTSMFQDVNNSSEIILWIFIAFILILLFKNSMEYLQKYKKYYLYFVFGLFIFSILQLNNMLISGNNSEFLYFNF